MAGSGDEIIIRSEKIYKVGARRERSPSVLPIVWSRAEIVRDGTVQYMELWLPFGYHLCQNPDVEYANFDGKTIDAQLELAEE
jgi:hypothetical protein